MITRKELVAVGRSLGFNTYQAEKDYLQHAFLAALYAISGKEFVFKGGTALQKAFGLDRFSEDLDFTFAGNGKKPAEFLQTAVAEFKKFTEAGVARTEENERSVSMKVKARGPLYNGTDLSMQTIILEVSLREKLLKAPAIKRVVPPYADLRPYVALCMDPEEILAEKVRAVMTRERPRDVYDLWFLLKKNTAFNREYADAKLAYYRKKFSISEFEKAAKNKERAWEKELKILLGNVPPFKETCQEAIGLIAKQAKA